MDTSPRRITKAQKAGGRAFTGGWLRRLLREAGSRRIANIFENNITRGRVEMTFPGGSTVIFKGTQDGQEDGPVARVTIRRWRAIWRFAFGGTLGMAHGYIEEDWTTPDLVSVVELGAANTGSLRTTLKGLGWIRALRRWQHLRRANSPRGSRRNTAFHYDMGNDFYSQWLDPGMTYSSAVFTGDTLSLEDAQREKYRRLLDLLDVRPGEHILEIGCGWGGFAEVAAKERGTHVTGITLSRAQAVFARKRITNAGLEDLVSIRYCDYRDIEGEFDHVVSIEMLEAVGEKYWKSYFSKIHAVLKPGGRAALQVITIDDRVFPEYRKSVDFIQAYIFPGGLLPSLGALKDEVQRAGLTWGKADAYGPHYARTLGLWRERFDAACREKTLPEEYDDAFQRIWTYYMAYSEGGFRGGAIDVYQMVFARPEQAQEDQVLNRADSGAIQRKS